MAYRFKSRLGSAVFMGLGFILPISNSHAQYSEQKERELLAPWGDVNQVIKKQFCLQPPEKTSSIADASLSELQAILSNKTVRARHSSRSSGATRTEGVIFEVSPAPPSSFGVKMQYTTRKGKTSLTSMDVAV